MSKKLSISKAIGEALHEEMARDENVIIMGEDMGKMGNVFGITVGFQEEFGENPDFRIRLLWHGSGGCNERDSPCGRVDV